jgi:hypothetical protein
MSKNILLAVDAASHDPVRHVVAAADKDHQTLRLCLMPSFKQRVMGH